MPLLPTATLTLLLCRLQTYNELIDCHEGMLSDASGIINMREAEVEQLKVRSFRRAG